ncbi:MAG: hypothetical protein WBM68_07750 [Woeseia sp.]
MPSQRRKLVTIITESAIEEKVCRTIAKLGATGYTVTDARGSGSRGARNARWSSSGNVRIEVVCDDVVAARIASYLQENFYADYAMVLFETDVSVLRPEKF